MDPTIGHTIVICKETKRTLVPEDRMLEYRKQGLTHISQNSHTLVGVLIFLESIHLESLKQPQICGNMPLLSNTRNMYPDYFIESRQKKLN